MVRDPSSVENGVGLGLALRFDADEDKSERFGDGFTELGDERELLVSVDLRS